MRPLKIKNAKGEIKIVNFSLQ